jgi:hypothetical protein
LFHPYEARAQAKLERKQKNEVQAKEVVEQARAKRKALEQQRIVHTNERRKDEIYARRCASPFSSLSLASQFLHFCRYRCTIICWSDKEGYRTIAFDCDAQRN